MFKRSIAILPVFLVLLTTVFSGCSWISDAEEQSPLAIIMTFDKENYQPGEMVVAEIEVVNMLDETIVMEQPFSAVLSRDSNLHVRVSPSELYDPLRHGPVMIREDVEPALVAVPPYQSRRIKCAFTMMTENTGDYVAWAEYTRAPYKFKVPGAALQSENLEQMDFYMARSEPVPFKVTGERRFDRTGGGILTRESAVKVAMEEYSRPTSSSLAALIETQSDLVEWWVTLEKKPEDIGQGESKYVSYFISPYGGFVHGEAPHIGRNPVKFRLEEMRKDLKRPPRNSLLKPMRPIGDSSVAAPPKAQP